MISPFNLRWNNKSVDFLLDLNIEFPPDLAISQYAAHNQPPESEVCFAMLRAIRPGMNVVDGGASVGFFTLLMSKLVGPEGRVYAFEPDKRSMEKLQRNLNVNKCSNVRAQNIALWSSAGHTLELHLHEDPGFNSLYQTGFSHNASDVGTGAMDGLVEGRKIGLIKLDIEGAEFRALRGARSILQDNPVVIVEMNETALERAGTSFAAIRELLAPMDSFALSNSGHFPMYIPKDVPMKAVRQNTNIMFTTMERVKEMWPEAAL